MNLTGWILMSVFGFWVDLGGSEWIKAGSGWNLSGFVGSVWIRYGSRWILVCLDGSVWIAVDLGGTGRILVRSGCAGGSWWIWVDGYCVDLG